MKSFTAWTMRLVLVALALGAAWGVWRWSQLGAKLGPGFAQGNGRIEATEIGIATKTAGKVAKILVQEGDFVEQGDVVALMDMETVRAQLDQAKAELANARSAKESARAAVAQRQADVAAAQATHRQRLSELDVDRKTNLRMQALLKRDAVSVQEADESEAKMRNAQAYVEAARSQIIAAEAAVTAALAQVDQAQASIEAAEAVIQRLQQELDDGTLRAPLSGRIQYRIAEPGEVLASGGKVLSLLDVSYVYMTFFLPEMEAGKTGLGSEVRLVLDAAPEYVIPAEVSFVASVAQFTPKTVETEAERQKMMFRVRARISPDILKQYPKYVKTGLPGMAYVRLDSERPWPDWLQVRLP